MWRAFGLLLFGFVGGLALVGCADLSYYRQAVAGQLALLYAARPVADVLADPATPPALRQRLQQTQALRSFANTDLALPDNGSYRHYADLGRPYAVQNVFAAPALSLEPRQWCYLTVGCLSYRGYFDAEAARELATQMRMAGDDVYVAEIPAYSTLGWLDDPLLNTFTLWPVGRLAELMFHELAHQRLYIADDTGFNEAFATAVGRLGAERWLKQHGTARERADYQADCQRRDDFLALTGAARERLQVVYASSRTDTIKQVEKQAILTNLREDYQRLKQHWNGYAGYDRWFAHDLNNAKLAGNSTYYRWVAAFFALYRQQNQDFPAFYRAVEALGQLSAVERAARLGALSASAAHSVLKTEQAEEEVAVIDRRHHAH
ncbi:MAG: aminopeptidase [Candidatus Competibacter denitrificans]